MKRDVRFGALLLAALPAACGGGGGGGGGSGGGAGVADCNPVGHVTSTGTASPQIQNPDAAGDGNLETFATILANSGTTQTATIRVTASSGTFPAGSQAGAFLTPPSAATFNSTTINTYLGGALQESASGPSLKVSSTHGTTAAADYDYIQTTKMFDAVEVAVTLNNTGTSSPSYRIYELCSNGGV